MPARLCPEVQLRRRLSCAPAFDTAKRESASEFSELSFTSSGTSHTAWASSEGVTADMPSQHCSLLFGVQKPDKKLGYVRVPVDEVARNKSMKDQWPLLDADKGDIVLRCPCATAALSQSCPATLPNLPRLQMHVRT